MNKSRSVTTTYFSGVIFAHHIYLSVYSLPFLFYYFIFLAGGGGGGGGGKKWLTSNCDTI